MSDATADNLRRIDNYIQDLFPPDDALLHALKTSRENDLPQINVSPNQGRILNILARLSGARTIVEIGTLRRHVGLPRSMAGLFPVRARLENRVLTVEMKEAQ